LLQRIPHHAKAFCRPILVVAAHVILVVAVLPILYLLEPFRPVRITHFATERMGHLSGDIHLFRARRFIAGKKDRFFRIFLGGYPCNQALLNIWKRYLPINDNPWLSTFWHYCKNTLARTRFDLPETQTTNIHFEYAKFADYPEFTAEEEEQGRELLDKIGIGPTDWFVTFHVRDSAYGRYRFPHLEVQESPRNGNINDYLMAANAIVNMGGFAIRVGDVTQDPLGCRTTDKIVDYSHDFRSEFGDVYLAAKCRFFLGGPSGLPQLSTIFGVPVAMASMVPVTPHPVGPDALFAPVRICDRGTGRVLHYREAHELGMFDNREGYQWRDTQYDEEGFDVLQSSPEDIRDLALDMIDQTNDVRPSDDTARLQNIYRHEYANCGAGYEYAPTIAPRFAMKYRHLIEAQ